MACLGTSAFPSLTNFLLLLLLKYSIGFRPGGGGGRLSYLEKGALLSGGGTRYSKVHGPEIVSSLSDRAGPFHLSASWPPSHLPRVSFSLFWGGEEKTGKGGGRLCDGVLSLSSSRSRAPRFLPSPLYTGSLAHRGKRVDGPWRRTCMYSMYACGSACLPACLLPRDSARSAAPPLGLSADDSLAPACPCAARSFERGCVCVLRIYGRSASGGGERERAWVPGLGARPECST